MDSEPESNESLIFKLPPKEVDVTVGSTNEGVRITKEPQGFVTYRFLPPYQWRPPKPDSLPKTVDLTPLAIYDENDGQWKTFLAPAAFVRKLLEIGAEIDKPDFHLTLKKTPG